MRKNVVLIETIDSMGTGIMYPCKIAEDMRRKNAQYFIIFTNAHVLQDIGNAKKEENAKNQIQLQFFDDLGERVREEAIEEIRVFHPGWSLEKEDDIAALLVAVSNVVTITLETAIYGKALDNRETLYMEGYLGIMSEDEVSQKIQLQGMEKSIFPENKKLGVYQITDDYHWYNDFHDRQLLSGLSGSPVYIEKNGQTMLVGINQSVSDIRHGENPFKLVYYIKMESVLTDHKNRYYL